MNELFLHYGIDLKLIIAGFMGGVVHTFFFKQTDPYTVIGSVVSGMFTANFMGPVLANATGYSIGTCGFVAGFGAMALCQGAVSAIKARLGLKEEKAREKDDGHQP